MGENIDKVCEILQKTYLLIPQNTPTNKESMIIEFLSKGIVPWWGRD